MGNAWAVFFSVCSVNLLAPPDSGGAGAGVKAGGGGEQQLHSLQFFITVQFPAPDLPQLGKPYFRHSSKSTNVTSQKVSAQSNIHPPNYQRCLLTLGLIYQPWVRRKLRTAIVREGWCFSSERMIPLKSHVRSDITDAKSV